MATLMTSLARGSEPYPGYKLGRFIGRGSWGEVWHATDPAGSDVALKFITCDNPVLAAREIRALQSIRQLTHPHLVNIHHIWASSGHVVIAMELAEGNLLDLLHIYLEEYQRPIFPDHLCHYLRQAAAALDFLNARQHTINGRLVAVRHGDVKPSNLLVVGKKIKVADFSLSIQTASTMWYHDRAGTLNYAAPELFQGCISDRTDQYALAITYYELRTGRLPFPDTPQRFDPKYVRPVPDLSLISVPEQLVLLRALHPIPQNRWPSCTEMMDQLTQAVTKWR